MDNKQQTELLKEINAFLDKLENKEKGMAFLERLFEKERVLHQYDEKSNTFKPLTDWAKNVSVK